MWQPPPYREPRSAGRRTGPAIEEAHIHIHPDISRYIAAERTQEMRARAAQRHLARQVARQVLGSATRAARRTFLAARPLAHPPGELDLAAPGARAPAEREHGDDLVAAGPAGQR